MSFEDRDVMVPAAEAAQVLGTTKLNLLMHLKRRHLEGLEIEGQWYVTRESLARLQVSLSPDLKAELCRSVCSGGGCAGCG